MNDKQVGFPLGRSIWESINFMWKRNKEISDPDSFFKVTKNVYQKYLNSIKGIVKEENDLLFLSIWGGVYVYDFLKSMDIISDETYNNFLNINKQLKGKAIHNNIEYLWKFDFIHTWKKPDSVSETEFEAEKSIFEKTFENYISNFSKAKYLFREELHNIGELSEYILDAEKKHIERRKRNKGKKQNINPKKLELLKLIEKEKQKLVDDYYYNKVMNRSNQSQVKIEEKVGRNNPCPCGSGKKYKKCCMKKDNND